MSSPPSRDADRTLTGLMLMIVGFGLVWIPEVGAIGSLLLLIGVVIVWMGRRAFGEAHALYATAGAVLVILALLVGIVLAIWFVAAVVSAATSGASLPALGSVLHSDLEVLFVAGWAGGLLGLLGYVLLPYSIADRSARLLLWGAFGLSIVISAVDYSLLWPQISTAISQATSGSTINVGPVQALDTRSALYGAAQIVPDLLFLWAYYRVRSIARVRFVPAGARSPGSM